MIRIKRITTEDELYAQECALREGVLLSSVGLDMAAFQKAYPDHEERFEHFVAVFDHPKGERVVACAVLLPPREGEESGKVMQVAVDPQRQGEGIGRRLMVAVEARAFGELGLSELYCHAQESAVPFYERLGWKTGDPPFEEAGIPHLRMSIQHAVPTPEPPAPPPD